LLNNTVAKEPWRETPRFICTTKRAVIERSRDFSGQSLAISGCELSLSTVA